MSIDPYDHVICIKCYYRDLLVKMLKFAFLGVYGYTLYHRQAQPSLVSILRINWYLFVPHLFLFISLFISFSFRISLVFFSLSSCFVFRIFVLLFLPFTFPFPNIFEYLYTHVLVVSQYFRNNKSYFTPRFTSHRRLIINSAFRCNLRHRLARRVHL